MFAKKLYPVYVVITLTFVNVLILMDRQILTVSAEDIKTDLRLSDADLGFLYGTGISVFYAIFSIPLGRLADIWSRKRILAICVASWSVMIGLTGAARDFISFAAARVGVGVGEAGAGPAALSMISDHVPLRWRTTAMAVFASGVQLGNGLGIFMGGQILETWARLFPNPADAPFGLRGWQVAFVSAAVIGPLVSLWLVSLKEPRRGAVDNLNASNTHATLGDAWKDLRSVVPILCLPSLYEAGRLRAVAMNLALAVTVGVTGAGLILLTGSVAQWCAIAFGVWCLICWAHSLSLRDRVLFDMIFRCPTLLLCNVGIAGFVFLAIGIMAWIVPYLMRSYGLGAGEVGSAIGTLTIVFGCTGAIVGGACADVLQRYTRKARILVMLAALIVTVPAVLSLLWAQSIETAYASIAVFIASSSAWYGIGPSIANSLVTPNARGISSALYLIFVTMGGVALGPYTVGFLSDTFGREGLDSADSLAAAFYWTLTVAAVIVPAFILALHFVDRNSDRVGLVPTV